MTILGIVSLQFTSCKIDILLCRILVSPLMMSESDPVAAIPNMDSVFSVSFDTIFGDPSLSCSFSSVKEHK